MNEKLPRVKLAITEQREYLQRLARGDRYETPNKENAEGRYDGSPLSHAELNQSSSSQRQDKTCPWQQSPDVIRVPNPKTPIQASPSAFRAVSDEKTQLHKFEKGRYGRALFCKKTYRQRTSLGQPAAEQPAQKTQDTGSASPQPPITPLSRILWSFGLDVHQTVCDERDERRAAEQACTDPEQPQSAPKDCSHEAQDEEAKNGDETGDR